MNFWTRIRPLLLLVIAAAIPFASARAAVLVDTGLPDLTNNTAINHDQFVMLKFTIPPGVPHRLTSVMVFSDIGPGESIDYTLSRTSGTGATLTDVIAQNTIGSGAQEGYMEVLNSSVVVEPGDYFVVVSSSGANAGSLAIRAPVVPAGVEAFFTQTGFGLDPSFPTASDWFGLDEATQNYGLRVSGTPVSLPSRVAVFDDPAWVDTSGGPLAESDTVQASLNTIGHTISTFTDLDASDFTNALFNADALLFPKFEPGPAPILDPDAASVIISFVGGGGRLVIHSADGAARDFLNTVFGFSLTPASSPYEVWLDVTSAAGTDFEGGPARIFANSNTTAVDNLPPAAHAIYPNESSGAVVAHIPYGEGEVIFMGWDWRNAVPLGNRNDGWLDVLDRAVRGPIALPFSETTPTVIDGEGGEALEEGIGKVEYFSVGAGAEVLDIDVTVEFAKCNDQATSIGCLTDDGTPPHFEEIEISATLGNPTAYNRKLLEVGTWDPGNANFDGVIRFDESAPVSVAALGGPVSGVFRPMEDYSNRIAVPGTFELRVRDLRGGNPLLYRSSTVHLRRGEDLYDYAPTLVDGATVERPLPITSSGTIDDVNLFVSFSKCNDAANQYGCLSSDGTSPQFDEIEIELESPAGTTALLVPSGTWATGDAPSAQYVALRLDDNAASPLQGTARPTSGTFRPVNPLSAFDGEDMSGTWILRVSDSAVGNPLPFVDAELTVLLPWEDLTDPYWELLDNAPVLRTVDVSAEGTIVDVDLIVDFAKCNGAADATGCLEDTGYSPQLDDIAFRLTAPSGTEIDLVDFDSWVPGSTNFSGAVEFDDEAQSTGSFPFAGGRSPLQSLDAFDGENPAGIWTLSIANRYGYGAPLVYRSMSLQLTVDPTDPDGDGDGIPDDSDNCPSDANADQADADADDIGDACDDSDFDLVLDAFDNCPVVSNTDQENFDGDAHGDHCDNCVYIANDSQSDSNSDGRGDACELDFDADGVEDSQDNCPFLPNASQSDADDDGTGDACEFGGPTSTVVFNQMSQATDAPVYRWAAGCSGAGCENQIALPAPGGGQCVMSAISETEMTLDYSYVGEVPPDGFACCAWEADCPIGCLTPACPVGTVCTGDAGDPSCCFESAGIETYQWGSHAGEPPYYSDPDPLPDQCDNCAYVDNPEQDDLDGDDVGDLCDSCPLVSNSGQEDADGDVRGDACDTENRSRYVCGDTDSDGCDDCSYGFFDPNNDGIDPDETPICVPEPDPVSMVIFGVIGLMVLFRCSAIEVRLAK